MKYDQRLNNRFSLLYVFICRRVRQKPTWASSIFTFSLVNFSLVSRRKSSKLKYFYINPFLLMFLTFKNSLNFAFLFRKCLKTDVKINTFFKTREIRWLNSFTGLASDWLSAILSADRRAPPRLRFWRTVSFDLTVTWSAVPRGRWNALI